MCKSGCIVLLRLLILTFCLQTYPAVAIAATPGCSECHRCTEYDKNGNCTNCEPDERYCSLVEIEVIEQGCAYFKSLYRYTLTDAACPVAPGNYENYIEPVCSSYDFNYSECYRWLEQHSSVFFAAICDWPSDMQSAIYAAGIPDCLATDSLGDGSPLRPTECQEFLDWCDTGSNWSSASSKCTDYGFTGTAYDNCISVCENMKGIEIDAVVSDPRSEGVCVACGVGEYFYYDGMLVESCNPCDAGTYQAKERHLETSCPTCPAGKYSLNGAASCTSCLDGYYNDMTGAWKCTKCPVDGNGDVAHSSAPRDSINTCYIEATVEQTDAIGTFRHAEDCAIQLVTE
ncbi:MAG: hypothetical protein ACLRFO_01515 [Alphaproteobacteria bacterium]